VTQLFDLNARIQQLTWSLIFYEKYSTSLSTIILVVLTTANFRRFSNFCRYYTRSQTGKSSGYRPTLKRLLLGSFGYLYSGQISNVATWSGLNFNTNVEVVLFKWENVIKTIWWLSVTSIAWGNHIGSLSYRQLVSMTCGMQLFHLVLHPSWSIDHLPNIAMHCLSEHIGGVS
jgi:hypothetical protein